MKTFVSLNNLKLLYVHFSEIININIISSRFSYSLPLLDWDPLTCNVTVLLPEIGEIRLQGVGASLKWKPQVPFKNMNFYFEL